MHAGWQLNKLLIFAALISGYDHIQSAFIEKWT